MAGLNAPSPNLTEDIEVGRFDVNINGSIKKKIDKQKLGLTTISLGAEYRYTNLRYNGLPDVIDNELVKDLHMLRLQIDFTKVFKMKWILSVLLRPGIYSDFENIDSDHFRLEGAVLLDYRKSQTTFIGFGVARSTRFGRLLVLPVFHYLYKSPKFTADILLPARVDVGWTQKKWYYGINASVSGNQYTIGSQFNNFVGKNTIGISDAVIGPNFRYYTNEKSYVFLTGGATAARRWEFRDDNLSGDDRFLQEFDPNITWFARAGFIIRH